MATLDLSKKGNDTIRADLQWLHDAPLFIDETQVRRFYDAVVRPAVKHGEMKVTLSQEKANEIAGKVGVEGGIEPGGLLAVISGLAKVSVKGTAEGNLANTTTEGKETEYVFEEIDTPQRQLIQLTIHYTLDHPARIFLTANPAEAPWRDPAVVSRVPRGLVFLNLPSQSESEAQKLPRTKFIPMAAEFANGTIDPLFRRIQAKNGERSPDYPDEPITAPGAASRYQDYWKWFDKHFSATAAMVLLEEAASRHGRIQWVDFRVPLTTEGHTLHLHLSPGGTFDTGVFAYNFIKRGFSHGIRLVGTMKSGPDMNVLAIYDK